MTTEFMNGSSKDSSNSKLTPDDDVTDSYVRFDQQIVLTKDQFELLKIISNAHDRPISDYIQKALIETMKDEIEFGDFCDILLDKLDSERELTRAVT
jgi:hypothetical protein